MILNSPYISGSLTVTNLSGSGVRYLMTSASGLLISQTADAAIKNTYTASATAGQTVFPVTNGYSTGLVDVYLNGTKLASSDYSDADGVNITLVTGSDAGDLLEFVKYSPALGVTNNALRQLTTFTSSEGQTVYSASYTPGLLDVYYNGSRLTSAEYTANNGTFITLATGSVAGDIVDVMTYTYQVGAFSGVGGTGVANQVAYWGTTNAITGSPNFTVSGSTLAVTGSFTVITGSVAEFTINPTGVNIGNTLTDSHVISGSLRVNPNGLFVSSSGFVGMGTTSPRYALDVQTSSGVNLSAATGSGLIRAITSGTGDGILIGQADSARSVGIGANQFKIYGDDYAIMTVGASPLFLATSGSTRLTVTSAGNVGIGTSSATSKLTVSGDLNVQAGTLSAFGFGLQMNSTFAFSGTAYRTAIFAYNTGDGNGIQLGYDASAGTGIIAASTNGAGAGTAFWTFNGSSWGERMRIRSDGNVNIGDTGGFSDTRFYVKGIGTGSGTFALVAKNSSGFDLFVVRDDGIINTGTRSGSPYNNTSGAAANLVVSSGGTLERSTSSLKYKKEVRDYDKGLAEVMAIRPVYYKGKSENDGDKQYAGLIAEEINELGLEEFVVYAEDGTPDALAYQNMIALLTKAIQEQQAKITALEEKLERNNIQ